MLLPLVSGEGYALSGSVVGKGRGLGIFWVSLHDLVKPDDPQGFLNPIWCKPSSGPYPLWALERRETPPLYREALPEGPPCSVFAAGRAYLSRELGICSSRAFGHINPQGCDFHTEPSLSFYDAAILTHWAVTSCEGDGPFH